MWETTAAEKRTMGRKTGKLPAFPGKIQIQSDGGEGENAADKR